MSRVKIEQNITRNTLLWLLITNLAIITPLYDKLTLWTGGICAICFVWRVGIYFGRVSKPPRLLVTLLAIGAAATLLLVSSHIGALNSLVNLLILGYALKYIESSTRRDVRAIVLVGYFLIALTFIYNQSLWNTLHLLIICSINTCVLISLYQEKVKFFITSKLGFTLVLQSLPLALLLFIVLPRLPPLWLVPDMKSATTGLSDQVNFGDVSELSRSDKLAFRATFDGNIPPNSELYWRALVMEDYDGKTWSQSPGIKEVESSALLFLPDRVGPKGPILSYTIIAEPSHQHWLFGLDQAFSDDRDIVHLPDYRLYSLRAVDQKMQYKVLSATQQAMDLTLHTQVRKNNLSLPTGFNPQTRQLAQEFARQYPEPNKRVNAMMAYFNDNPYYYTLKPPRVGPEQIDDFLINNKAGYCVHYASALVYMARATGIPARLVTGYQGGEYNPKAGYISVYQYMAHAWVEVWLKNKGWTRFDPTAMIAPERVEQGFDAVFDSAESYRQDSLLGNIDIKNLPMLNDIRLALSSIDYYWSVWVLGFDDDKQQALLENLLGKVDASKLIILMLVSLSVIGLAIGYSVGLFSLPERQDPINRQYNNIIKLLAKKGILKDQQTGPSDFSKTVNELAPELGKEFSRFTQHYIALKYQELPQSTYSKCLKLYLKQARTLRVAVFKQAHVDSGKSKT